jgi:hypothetical protein
MKADRLSQEKLMTISEWIDTRFCDPKPLPQTVSKWCRKGKVPAKQIDRKWFIKVKQELIETGDPLVDNVLKSTAGF